MKRLIPSIVFTFALLLLPGLAWAQQGTITGTVTEAETGDPLPGATVQVLDEGAGAAADSDGQFRITEVPAGEQTIRVTFVGYQSEERTVTVPEEGTVRANFQLASEAAALGEVTVTGYRTEQEDIETGASGTIDSDIIERSNIQSADQALQGTTPGVRVTSSSGQPGAAIDVQVRGAGSITAGTDPLYIVDGVQISTDDPFSQGSGNPLANLNPNDIESIQVLRDAAASSIYGAQASNGVVLITTKRGRSGAGTEISFNAEIGRVGQLNEYEVGSTEQWADYVGSAVANGLNQSFGGDFFDEEDGRNIAFNQDSECPLDPFELGDLCRTQVAAGGLLFGSDSLNVDWPSETYRTATTQSYDLSFRGGDEQTQFYVSGNYSFDQGQIIDSKLKEGGLRANLTHEVRDWLNVDANVNVTTLNVQGTIEDGPFINSPFWASYFIPPNAPVYSEPGNEGSGFNLNPNFVFSYNPVAQEEFNTRKSNNTQINGSVALNFSLSESWTTRTNGGLQFQDTKEENYEDPRLPPNANTGGEHEVPQERIINYNVSQTLNYDNVLADMHSVSGLLGAEYKKEEEVGTFLQGQGFPNNLFRTAASAATPTSASFARTEFRQISVFGDLQYTYDRTYQLRSTLRYDGNSRFGQDKRYGLFGTVSGYWRVSEESFLRDAGFLTDLKLRASYGVTGNSEIGNFQSRRLFGSSGAYNGQSAIGPSSLGNVELTWEEKRELNIGLDYALFGGRISGSIDAYTNSNDELLLNRDLPLDSGYGSFIDNVGTLDNRGLEFRLETVNVDRAFRWTTNFNVTFQDSEVASLLPDDDEIVSGAQPGGDVYRVGEAPGQYRQTPWAGVNPANGVPLYEDANGNLTYDPTDPADDRLIGNNNPDFYGGLMNTFSFSGITAEVFFQYDYGRTTFNNDMYFLESNTFFFNNRREDTYDFWREPGDVTDTPFPTINNQYGPFAGFDGASGFGSTRYIEDASYIRLKRIRVDYSLPSSILNELPGLEELSIYVQGRNLATFTEFTGFDPEVIGTSLGSYPQGRIYTGGINATF